VAIRRKTGLIVVGVAALLLLALIFVAHSLIKVDRYTDLELDNQRISSRVIDIDGYGVAVDGSGSVSVSGSYELNYRGLAEITTKEGFFTNTVARLSGATLKDGKLQFPFRIAGTIDSPVFSKGKGDQDVDAVQKPK